MISEWVDMFGAVRIELRFSVKLDKFEPEGFSGESLCGWFGAIAAASKKIFAATERVALPRKEAIFWRF